MASLLARRRREIGTRVEILSDVLSWRFAKTASNAEVNPVAHRLAERRRNGGHVRDVFKALVRELDRHTAQDVTQSDKGLCGQFAGRYDPWEAKAARQQSLKKEVVRARQQEDNRFLEGVCEMLIKSRYHLASVEDWQYARDHSYGFSVPIKVRWAAYDKSLLDEISPRLYSDKRLRTRISKAETHVKIPEEAQFALVFHRGVGMDRTTKHFIPEKTDELIRRGALWGYRIVYSAVSNIVGRMKRRVNTWHIKSRLRSATFMSHASKTVASVSARGGKVYLDGLKWVENRVGDRITKLQTPVQDLIPDISQTEPGKIIEGLPTNPMEIVPQLATSETAWPPAKDDALGMKDLDPADSIEIDEGRDRLMEEAFHARIPMAEMPLGPLSFFRRFTLQEIIYKDVVVIYRMKHPEVPSTLSLREARMFKEQGLDGVAREANSRNITIKHFRDIPISDVEMLMPEKRVYLKLTDSFNYSVMGLLGASALVGLNNGSSMMNPASIAAAVASGSYFARVFSKMYMSWSYYTTMTNAFWAENVTATGQAAIAWITRGAKDQTVKEATIVLLAMFELAEEHESVSIREVEEQCRVILQYTYTPASDHFDPSEALESLIRFNYVETVEGGTDELGKSLYRLTDLGDEALALQAP
mmetsp:Transcript_23106/g.40916  ORF Transcript_23106/g.40916 Transcript_23106/m.40916 type:complete len:645 (-) Transcript_23106:91-2025(-)